MGTSSTRPVDSSTVLATGGRQARALSWTVSLSRAGQTDNTCIPSASCLSPQGAGQMLQLPFLTAFTVVCTFHLIQTLCRQRLENTSVHCTEREVLSSVHVRAFAVWKKVKWEQQGLGRSPALHKYVRPP